MWNVVDRQTGRLEGTQPGEHADRQTGKANVYKPKSLTEVSLLDWQAGNRQAGQSDVYKRKPLFMFPTETRLATVGLAANGRSTTDWLTDRQPDWLSD